MTSVLCTDIGPEMAAPGMAASVHLRPSGWNYYDRSPS